MSVSIRMYNTGFGDCFLLSFATAQGTRRILVDCGAHAMAPGPFAMERIVDDILDTLRADGTPRLQAVIATHRHRDHVSGFAFAHWNDVEVEEVWMPWTEHPADPEAMRIRNRQSSMARRLTFALERLAAAPGANAEAAAQFRFSQNNLTNADAMRTLHEGFRNVTARRFLPEADSPFAARQIPGIAGLEAYVLGPSREPKVIRDMIPPETEHYLRVDEAGAETPPIDPFPGFPSYSRSDFEAFLRERDGASGSLWSDLLNEKVRPDSGDRQIHRAHRRNQQFSKETAKGIASEGNHDLFAIATSLEKAVNGTSLMVLFRFGSQYLLFPGDAQWGSWDAVLRDPARRALLDRTTFLKVAHHGSENATPKELVEKALPRGAFAMCPTISTRLWPFIPKPELLQALEEQGAVIARSDDSPSVPYRRHPDGLYTELDLPSGS